MSSAGEDAGSDPQETPCQHVHTFPVEGMNFTLGLEGEQRGAAGERNIYRMTLCQDCGVLQGVLDHAE